MKHLLRLVSRTRSLSLLALSWVGFSLCMMGCADDSAPEIVQPTQEPVSLVFDEATVPGPATSTLLAEAENYPVSITVAEATQREPSPENDRTILTVEAPERLGKLPGALESRKVQLHKSTPALKEGMVSKETGWWNRPMDRHSKKWTAAKGTVPNDARKAASHSVRKRDKKEYEAGKLTVLRAVTCANVANRNPVDAKSTFSMRDDKVWVWLQLQNSGPSTQVDLVWKKDGEKKWTVDLNVGHGRRWRTWARKSIRRVNVGSWTVEVHDLEGNVLETVAFNVQGTSAAEVSGVQ
jgi:hypothetical protein